MPTQVTPPTQVNPQTQVNQQTQVDPVIEFWIRLVILLNGPLLEALLQVLHNKNKDATYTGLPEDPSDLYKELSTTHKATIDGLVKKKVLKKDQLDIVLPINGDKKTYSKNFDVTIIVVLIINCTKLPHPIGGWNQKDPQPADKGVAANSLRGRNWRNFLNHVVPSTIDQQTFDQEWDKGVEIVKGLGGSVANIADLKTMSLDQKHEVVLKAIQTFNNKLAAEQQNQKQDISYLKTEHQNQKKNIFDLKSKVDFDIPNQQQKLEEEQQDQKQEMYDLKEKQQKQQQDMSDLNNKQQNLKTEQQNQMKEQQNLKQEISDIKEKQEKQEQKFNDTTSIDKDNLGNKFY